MMTHKFTAGILFINIVWAQVLTHGTADICRRQDGKVCSFPLLCDVGLISVTEVKTHYDICPSNTRCDYCCQKDVKLNNNATTSMQKECDNKSQCDPAIVFTVTGVGQAEVSFTCSVKDEPTTTAKPVSTTDIAHLSSVYGTRVHETRRSTYTAEVECPYYTYGHHCTPCGQCKNGSCDPVTGECPHGCFDGYVGKTCERLITDNSAKSHAVSTVTAGFVEARAMSNVTAGIVGAVVGVVTTVLVVAVVLAVLWTIKRRVPIYEQPLAMVSVGESTYDTLQDQSKQNVYATGSNPVYGNTI